MRQLGLTIALFLGVAGTGVSAGEIVLRGLVTLKEGSIAHLSAGSGQGQWCREGDTFEGWTLTSIQAGNSRVFLTTKDGSTRTIVLQSTSIAHGAPKPANGQLLDPASLDWAWIRSDRNPMRDAPEPLPMSVIQTWAGLDEDLKTEFRNYYRAHGWELTGVEVRGERSHQSVSPLRNPHEPAPSAEDVRKRSKAAGKAGAAAPRP